MYDIIHYCNCVVNKFYLTSININSSKKPKTLMPAALSMMHKILVQSETLTITNFCKSVYEF